MESIILPLNRLGGQFVHFAGPMLLQSSLLIILLLGLEAVLRHRIRAVVRYGLCMLILVKLVLPTSFSLPTGIGYWVERDPLARLVTKQPRVSAADVAPVPMNAVENAKPLPGFSSARSTSLAPKASGEFPSELVSIAPPLRPRLALPGVLFLAWLLGASALSIFFLQRWRFVSRLIASASEAPEALQNILFDCARELGLKRRVTLKIIESSGSPAACGLVRPVILLPDALIAKLGKSNSALYFFTNSFTSDVATSG